MSKTTKTTKTDELQASATNAAKRYLELSGYEILERDWSCDAGTYDLIARDADDSIVFCKIGASEGVLDFPPENHSTSLRTEFERCAMRYLASSDLVDVPVRLDVIRLMVIAHDKAFLRHYCNALSKAL